MPLDHFSMPTFPARGYCQSQNKLLWGDLPLDPERPPFHLLRSWVAVGPSASECWECAQPFAIESLLSNLLSKTRGRAEALDGRAVRGGRCARRVGQCLGVSGCRREHPPPRPALGPERILLALPPDDRVEGAARGR